jgi:hypothetical protein
MIISHKYKYLFVELPRTASTAISHELCELYDGVPVLRKHATYYDFLKNANPEEQQYFVFSCIRNPLDDAVSYYFKLRTNHKDKFTNPKKLKRRKGLVNYIDRRLFSFIRSTNADFSTFFTRVYRVPYNNWASMSHRDFDFIIRFENLQEDFARALALIGIEQVRPIPTINKTAGKGRDFVSCYSPRVIRRAKWVFGPYMRQWGYDLPAEWGHAKVSWLNQAEFDVINVFRTFYWKYLRSRV